MAQPLESQRKYFQTGETRSYAFRKQALLSLKRALARHDKNLLSALKNDLEKSEFEGYESELGLVYGEIEEALHHLKRWMKPKRVAAPLMHFPAKGRMYARPLGVVLIIAPWNYPVLLSLTPLVGALAAGNCVTLKCSEFAPHCEQALASLIADAFAPEHVCMVQGGADISEALTKERYDHIFFTGSTQVGRKVMTAAADNLIPVTLELGGKSPCIVEQSADLPLAARRIVWGKFVNAGQTCVAPDYLLVHYSVKDRTISELCREIVRQYGEYPLENREYGKIISPCHFQRLVRLINPKKVVFGGNWNKKSLKIEPTILDGVLPNDAVMREEIFGPILPVISYHDEEELIRFLREREYPLALYLFSGNQAFCKRVMQAVPFGGGCVGDTLVHITSAKLPFGGVGHSGMGSYHGKRSFDTFTHTQSVMEKGSLDIPFRYPPYGRKLSVLRWIMKHFQ